MDIGNKLQWGVASKGLGVGTFNLGSELLSKIVVSVVVLPIVLKELVIFSFSRGIFPAGTLKLL